ncbi:MAG: M20/M25/M40 family metallo-hydrolase [Bacteroidota bacterium]
MIKKIFLSILLIVLVLTGIVIFNTIRFSKEITKKTSSDLPNLPDSAVSHMQQAIRVKTISLGNGEPVDTAQFLAFWQFIEKNYPLVHQSLTHQTFNGLSRLYKWEGKHPEQKPYVLMAHYDVVPVEASTENLWTVPAFGGVLKNDTIYGRGAADDKVSLISILEAVEKLLADHFQPERTIYLSFGNDEETIGKGAQAIAKYMEDNKIHPEVILDEGGEITTENFTELKRPVALIAVAEKGYMSFNLTVEQHGGHSSTPAPETAIDILAKGLVHLREKQMPYQFQPVIKELFNRIGPGMPFAERMAIANPWLFEKTLVGELEKDHSSNALIHTTIVPTIVQTGVKDNVIPSLATAVVNTRILPGTSVEEVEAFMNKQINDSRIKITKNSPPDRVGPAASYESIAYKKVEDATYKVMKDVVPVPFLSVGATDSKYLQHLADGTIKFTPVVDAKGFHGIDERIGVSDLKRLIFFYQIIIQGTGK